MKKCVVVGMLCLFVSAPCIAGQTKITAPGVEIKSDGSVSAPGVEIKPDGSVSAPGVEIQPLNKTESVNPKGDVVITENNSDQTFTLSSQSFVLSGSNNDIIINGSVTSITVTGNNNDIQYEKTAKNRVLVIDSGANNDIVAVAQH